MNLFLLGRRVLRRNPGPDWNITKAKASDISVYQRRSAREKPGQHTLPPRGSRIPPGCGWGLKWRKGCGAVRYNIAVSRRQPFYRPV